MRKRLAPHRQVIQATADDLLQAIKREIFGVAPKAINLGHWANLRTLGRYHREAREYARITGDDFRLCLLAGMAYELMIWACSTAAIATRDGPVLARNMDFWPEHELARNTYRIERRHGDTMRSVVAGWPGALGVVTGMSGRGFALALNAVWSTERLNKLGYPVMLFLRRVIDEARDFDHAVKLLSAQKLMSACLLTVIGVRNEQRVVIERTPTRAKLRRPDGDEALVTTNDYRTQVDEGVGAVNILTESSCGRFETLSAYCRMPEARQPSNELLLYGLSDPDIIQGITAQQVIARPAQNEFRVYVPRHLLKCQ